MNKKASCYNKKFGHDFRVVGGNCSECGINQETLSRQLKKIKYVVSKPVRGMHSEVHALAKDISEYCGEEKLFGMYLGIISKIGMKRAYQIFSELKDSDAKTKGKLFVYKSKFKNKEEEMDYIQNKKKK